MELENILETIVATAPAITSIISMIASVLVCIKKFGSLSEANIQKIDALTQDFKKQIEEERQETNEIKNINRELIRQNSELKKLLLEQKEKTANVRKVPYGKQNH